MSESTDVRANPLRFDGIYSRAQERWSSFFVFAPDGGVRALSLSQPCTIEDAAKQFILRSIPYEDKGHVVAQGDRVSFSTTSTTGTVDWKGIVEEQGAVLVLESHSHINGKRDAGERYEFAPMPDVGRLNPQLIPRCMWLDCLKMRTGTIYAHRCGIRADSSGWPLPTDAENEVGRWNVIGSRLHVNMTGGEEGSRQYVHDGSLGLLVANQGLHGSFYAGKSPLGKLAVARHVLAFYWPYSLMAEPTVSHYRDDRRLHVIIEDSEGDGHLGLQGITSPRGSSSFINSVFSIKNRQDEFLDQLGQARAAFLAQEAGTPGRASESGE